MSQFLLGVLWGVILSVALASVAVHYAPSRHVERLCDVSLTDRVGVPVVIVDRPCYATARIL